MGFGHSHDHDHGHDHPDHAPRAITRAIVITVLFMVVEFVGGWISNSLALISDAGHMLTDVGAMFLSLFAIWIARRPTTAQMTFGYHRAEILGALASGLAIWLLAGILVYEAIMRMSEPPEVQGKLVFIIATIGLAANLASMVMLHSAKKDNINVRAAYLHLIADSLGSVGAIVAGLVLWLSGWRLIDPIITILFSLLMLYSSWQLIREAVGILMESVPMGVDPSQIRNDLLGIRGVQEVHDLHIWAVSNKRSALSVHLIAREPEKVLNTANTLLKDKHGIRHTTIQIESPESFESEHCYDCSPIEAGGSR